MKVTRKQFIRQNRNKTISVRSLQNNRNLTPQMKRELAVADLNNDGFIKGNQETNTLFRRVDVFDRNGDGNSIDTNSSRNVMTIYQALTQATGEDGSGVRRSRPRGAGAMGTLLTRNPQVRSNQDLLNLFLRRNRNNWNAAETDARRHGTSLNKLTANRTAPVNSSASSSIDSSGPAEPLSRNNNVGSIGRVAGAHRTSPTFRQKVVQIARRLRMNPTHLMAVMSFESGESFSPSVRNRSTGATGLIQFMPKTARGMGTSTRALSRMTPERQLDYVERYLKPYAGKMNSVEDAYMAVLWPAAVGDGPNRSLFRKPSRAYRQNRGLDRNRNGVVTAREAAAKVRAKIH